jgi:nucleoside-diphosphate-sugar epimerase
VRALVTGSNGFIGSFLVEKLLSEGCDVRCLVRRTSNLRWIKDLPVDFVYGELRDPSTLVDAARDTDIVYHLGGVTRGRKMQHYIDGNYTATLNLLKACQEIGHAEQKFVFVSSQAAGGPSPDGRALTEEEAQQPISMYGRSKHMAEQAVLEFAETRPATIVRPPSVYGPRDTDFYMLFKNAQRGFLPVVGNGRQKISIIHINDLIAGLYLAGSKKQANGKIFFMTFDLPVSFADLIDIIAGAMGTKVRRINMPLAAVRMVVTASAIGSFLTKKPTIINHDKYMEMKQTAWICSGDKAKNLLGFQAHIGIEEGMRSTAAWYKAQGWL